MGSSSVAKLFQNGASQTIHLPAEFRFEGTKVFISRDEATGDVVLSTRPGAKAWAEMRHHLTSTGQPIGEVDMMIAAHALALGATPVTNNIRHYQRVPGGLLLENWTV